MKNTNQLAGGLATTCLLLAILVASSTAMANPFPPMPEPVVGPLEDAVNMDFLAQLTPAQLGVSSPPIDDVLVSDVWGWVSPRGQEYALVGTIEGLAIVRVSDPQNPAFMGTVPIARSSYRDLWRDVKFYNARERDYSRGNQRNYTGYAYVTTEAGGNGIIIIELNKLDDLPAAPDAHHTLSADRVWSEGGYDSSHNIFINQESGFAYLAGVGLDAGANACDSDSPKRFNTLILDLRSNPLSPTVVSCIENAGEHDFYVVNYKGPDKDYTGHEIAFVFDGRERNASGGTSTATGNGGLTEIWDVTDKDNISVVSSFDVPGMCFSHQGWTTKNQEFLLINDEVSGDSGGVNYLCPNEPWYENAGLFVVDIRDLDNPDYPDSQRFEIVAKGNAHNFMVVNRTLYWAAYSAGVRVIDLKRTKRGGSLGLQLTEIAHMDTEPRDYPLYYGLWGVYAFPNSGTIISSDMVNGLIMSRVSK